MPEDDPDPEIRELARKKIVDDARHARIARDAQRAGGVTETPERDPDATIDVFDSETA